MQGLLYLGLIKTVLLWITFLISYCSKNIGHVIYVFRIWHQGVPGNLGQVLCEFIGWLVSLYRVIVTVLESIHENHVVDSVKSGAEIEKAEQHDKACVSCHRCQTSL